MDEKTAKKMHQALTVSLTERRFLQRIKMSRKDMKLLLAELDTEQMASELANAPDINCKQILQICRPLIQRFAKEPEQGWLSYCFCLIRNQLFPGTEDFPEDEETNKAAILLYQIIRTVLAEDAAFRPFDRVRDFAFLSPEEANTFQSGEEYLRLMDAAERYYIYEFMKIGAETTPFNTLGHVAGVHYVAMHVARQLHARNLPVDLALISAAAASHDIGKYGCRKEEQSRIPYLHYFYTNQCLQKLDLPQVSHIASNHSTWDLELEDLSVESLLLIYADFRVKSTRDSDGNEEIHFYTLQEAFEVILSKLDNVDDAKRRRYEKVYAKLLDFEDYMRSIGVAPELDDEKGVASTWKDAALLDHRESIQRLKFLAIQHNIQIMHRFRTETDLGTLLEEARTERFGSDLMAYIYTLEEYFTYFTPAQKQMTIRFLQELLIDRGGNVRRHAAQLIGSIIAGYDEEYRKELPEGITLASEDVDSHKIWQSHLEKVIFIDPQRTDRQKRWIGYSLKFSLTTLLDNSEGEERAEYLDQFIRMLSAHKMDDQTVFILLDTILEIPLDICSPQQTHQIADFCRRMIKRSNKEVQVAALRVVCNFRQHISKDEAKADDLLLLETAVKKANPADGSACMDYLLAKAADSSSVIDYTVMFREIFRDNLKMGIPWVIKAVNIEVLLNSLETTCGEDAFYVATNLSNLLKVSDRVTVRQSAGEGLIRLFPLLNREQKNEIAVELTKSLEIGEFQYSKYIPQYLGVLIMQLDSEELDEILLELQNMICGSSDKIADVALSTLGVMLRQQPQGIHSSKIIGMILQGMANYKEPVSQEAFRVLGHVIFGDAALSLKQKADIFCRMHKKMLSLIEENDAAPLRFYNNAAALNNIYRFISDYEMDEEPLKTDEIRKVAFFPGTFDPFSLGHKGIVTEIRNQGFEVYLALDEFSWSKNTQPRTYRKKIMTMTCAGENNVYIFPDDLPINIANPEDIRT